MYAVIESGGKQYKVSKGDVIEVEKLSGSAGDIVNLKTLMTVKDDGSVLCGEAAEKSRVEAVVLGSVKSDKIVVYKYKPKKNVRKKIGHRQQYTKLKIETIV